MRLDELPRKARLGRSGRAAATPGGPRSGHAGTGLELMAWAWRFYLTKSGSGVSPFCHAVGDVDAIAPSHAIFMSKI